jgi:hypothetical protein
VYESEQLYWRHQIEESLECKDVLAQVDILGTEVSPVTAANATPWLEVWTLHTVEVAESNADAVAELLANTLDTRGQWYADYRNAQYHYIILRDKVFKVDRSDRAQYAQVKEYGVSRGIPEYQLDF